MRRITFINRVYPPDTGATGFMLRGLADGFRKAGWEVTIVAGGRRSVVEPCPATGVRVVRAAMPEGRSVTDALRQLAALARAVRRQPPPDLLVTMTDPPLLALLGPWLGTRTLHWSQDVYPDLLPVLGARIPSWLMRATDALVSASLKRHDQVVAIGDCMARKLLAKGVGDDRLSVIRNWPAEKPRRNEPANRAGLTGLYAGNFGRGHDFRAIVGAAEKLRHRPDIRFVMAGEGAALESVRRSAPANIEFLPRQDERAFAALAEKADLHLVTLKAEAAGLMVPSKMWAALAAGRPILFLGPDTSDVAAYVKRHGCGLVLPPDDGDRLADALAGFVDNPSSLAALRNAAGADEHWNRERAVAEFVDLAGRVVTGSAIETSRHPADDEAYV
ncbi:glycosyltransferase family 4 protein [Inquilinus sp. CAU 1745]|uniref:glycosyltransferase family 4 protein n=1 Tax=Inquilinus sp. CAU 1745 TaxID=3140369 RepID=UPI00325AD809